jgi:hypothetical protein
MFFDWANRRAQANPKIHRRILSTHHKRVPAASNLDLPSSHSFLIKIMSNHQSSFKSSTSECTWITSFWAASPDADWTQKSPVPAAQEGQQSQANENDVVGVHLSDNIRVILPPAAQKNSKKKHTGNPGNFRWQELHFHPHLKADDTEGLVLMFQAMARESIAIALSSQPGFSSDMFEIICGAAGNTVTTIRKRGGKQQASIPSRVCREDAWVSYWICLYNDKIYVGNGNVPGKDCYAVLDASKANQTAATDEQQKDEMAQQDDKEAVETADASTKVDEIATTAEKESCTPIQYVGFGNATKPGAKNDVKLQNILLTNLPPFMVEVLNGMPSQDELPIIVLPADTPEGKEMLQLLQDYRADCLTRKSRAAKYGTRYQEQPLESLLPWTKVKRLRENPVKGFATGLDLMDPKEREKQSARKARFASEEVTNDANGEVSSEHETTTEAEHAWDKETLLRPMRRDPPSHLWKNNDTSTPAKQDPFSIQPAKLATWVPEKLHLSSLDWAAFKQIRNQDIMSYFGEYRSSYIEWLGDISCNVCFADKHTAARALQNFSHDIPTPVPDSVVKIGTGKSNDIPDLGNMTWKLGKKAIRKVANDRHGRKGTMARVLMRLATSEDILIERPNKWPAPFPGAFSSTKVLGPASDFAPKKGEQNDGKQKKQRQEEPRRDSKPKRKRDKKIKKGQQGRDKSAETLLDSGLSSRRAGFSVEEMENERAAKKHRIDKS